MNDQTDPQLLRAYAEHRSDPAFAELVRRHVDLVHSAALRMVCDSHLAQDVTQGVFVALAKNAGQLTDRAVLSGWLHRTAQNIAAQTVRTDVRRRAREQEAAAMNELLAHEPDAHWEHIAPHLDAALGELPEPDRDALMLRYFERKTAREMAQTLGISDEAAQKRVSRAVEHLREFFAKRGVIVGAGGLVVVLTANAVQAAPVGLAVTISAAAALAGTTLTTTATATATKAIVMTTLQKTLVTATVAVLAGAGIYEARQASQLREHVQTLQQQQAPLAEQLKKLEDDRAEMAGQLASLNEDNERLKQGTAELLRLRGEVTRNKASEQELANDPIAMAAKSWLARVNKLKQRIQDDPRQAIPELQFVSEDDWLSAAKNRLETDQDFRQALGSIRSIASAKAAEKFLNGVKRFMAKNSGQFPSDLSELAGYLPQSMDASILSRWEIRRASEIKNHHMQGEWLIVEKSAVDEAYDWQWLVGADQTSCIPSGDRGQLDKAGIALIVEPVRQAFAAANGGRDPKNPAEALPYATTTEQREALQTLIRLYQQATQLPTNQNLQR